MLGRDIVLEAFKQYDVKYLFGNPGTTELPLIDGLVNYPDIEFIVSLHEDVCVGMAAGYAHATGKPGVINLHAAPGVGHGLGNIYNAYRAGVPLVVTAGQQDTRHSIQEPQLSGEIVSLVQPYTKWSYEVKNAVELPIVLQRAFKMAMTDPMGPVFLSFPSDVLWEEVQAHPIPLTRIPKTRGNLEAIKDAVNAIKHAKNPIIVAGDRVSLSGATASLIELAQFLGAGVYTEHQSSGLNFPYAHPQFLGRLLPNGPFLENAFKDYDLVMFVGQLSHAPLLHYDKQIIKSDTKIISIDSSEWQIGKNLHADIPIQGDPKSVIEEIYTYLKEIVSDDDLKRFSGFKDLAVKKNKERAKSREDEVQQLKGKTPLAPAVVMAELNKNLPTNIFLVDESVTSGKYVHDYLQLGEEAKLIALKGGGLGYGMPASVGAQLGCPDKRVVNVIGDGSSLYYIQSLWNAAKKNLPIIFVVMNNKSYMVLKGTLVHLNGEAAKKGYFPGMDLTEPQVDFVSVAKGFGVEAFRVEQYEDLSPAFQEAFKKSKPILLDIAIDPTVKVFHK